MKQSKLPKFVDVKYYPGHTYNQGKFEVTTYPRYLALGEDGRAYVYVVMDKMTWRMVGEE